MKKILLTLALICIAVCSYAQRDIPAGGYMDVASVETSFGDDVGVSKQVTLYKIKDKEGNPAFFLFASKVMATFTFGTVDSFSSLAIPSGCTILDFGTTYEDALQNLENLLDLFAQQDGAQLELTSRDGSVVPCTLHKGVLGKHIGLDGTYLSKSDVKSLRTGLKISKKLHKDL